MDTHFRARLNGLSLTSGATPGYEVLREKVRHSRLGSARALQLMEGAHQSSRDAGARFYPRQCPLWALETSMGSGAGLGFWGSWIAFCQWEKAFP